MRNLILFLIRYGAVILFIVYQFFCFHLMINYNQKQKDIFLNSSNLFSGFLSQKNQQLQNYFKLDEENYGLRQENARLLQNLINSDVPNIPNRQDSIDQLYTVIPSTVCSKTFKLRNNYLTLCHGNNRGFKKGMGVISDNGIVGIIQQTSERYSKVISVLNSSSRISVAIKNKRYHGNLIWDTYDNRYATIHNVRKHAVIAIGDTVITSGYSMVFPKDILVGVVESFDLKQGGDSYEIKVALKNEFDQIENVYVINHLLKDEFDELLENSNE